MNQFRYPWCFTNNNLDNENAVWTSGSKAILEQNSRDIVVDRHDCLTMDVDKDGILDIICLVGAHKGRGLGLNELCKSSFNSRVRTKQHVG